MVFLLYQPQNWQKCLFQLCITFSIPVTTQSRAFRINAFSSWNSFTSLANLFKWSPISFLCSSSWVSAHHQDDIVTNLTALQTRSFTLPAAFTRRREPTIAFYKPFSPRSCTIYSVSSAFRVSLPRKIAESIKADFSELFCFVSGVTCDKIHALSIHGFFAISSLPTDGGSSCLNSRVHQSQANLQKKKRTRRKKVSKNEIKRMSKKQKSWKPFLCGSSRLLDDAAWSVSLFIPIIQ